MMRRLPVPQLETYEVYDAAADAFEDNNLRARLIGAQNEIVMEERRYRDLAITGQLYLLQKSDTVVAGVSAAEMKELYKKGMSSAIGPARPFYDALMNGAPHGTCPLCGQGKVRNLDHYLPQSKFASLVVTPINLVPACRDCNVAKSSKTPTTTEEQTLNPYFDDFTNRRWLCASVVKNNPPVVLYDVCPPSDWMPSTGDRLRRHMDVFKLAATFTLYAGEELSQIAQELQYLHGIGGPTAVQEELRERAGNHEQTHRNSWQTAMYFALSESMWFCTDGLFLLRSISSLTSVV
jgi:hypothetical protein